jgi:hypothetical protein
MLKVEYLGRMEYDFQKSRVTGPWDHKVSVSANKVKKKFHACGPLRLRTYLLMLSTFMFFGITLSTVPIRYTVVEKPVKLRTKSPG